ncbi:helix-turn-helix transcriptional regulator [Zhongshania aquimaris]|uniref:Helix-turn-helix transcriptional regulator n=1 Tax=Zhongshania aquimaris TaxID=2857107 RepID=A0ABS6VX38_9GAMM|nr:helix-turn-helix transcriptional regulator [Zhongshania aquimaris]MBW2942191.1 helix-turn-helix transcriptional regulator [Zhongshania aquimaris]
MKDISVSEYSKLLIDLYDGHYGDDPYCNFLSGLREILELNFASITLREPIETNGGLLFISCDSLQKTYADSSDNPYTARYYTSNLMTNLSMGKVTTLDECVTCDSFETSDIYKMCMEPINIYHMAGLDLRNYNGERFSVRVCRPKSSDNFNQEEKDFFELIGSHIQRAISKAMQLIQIETERKLFANTVTGQSIGTFILDEQGKLLHRNQAAEEMISDSDGLEIENHQIKLDDPDSNSKLYGYINKIITATKEGSIPEVYAMPTQRSSGNTDYEILIKPLAIDKVVASTKTPHIIVFISAPEKRTQLDTKVLMSLFPFTEKEAELTKHLIIGSNLTESAEKLHISKNTARTHLRSIFLKTGVTQQSMLVSLILKSVAMLN